MVAFRQFERRFALALIAGLLAAPIAHAQSAPQENAAAPTPEKRNRWLDMLFLNRTNPEAAPQKQAPKQYIYCPKVDVISGAAAYTLYDKGQENNPLAVRYQARFDRLVRECVDLGAEAGIRIGISGRIALGPLGKPGVNVNVPVNYVVKDNFGAVVLKKSGVIPMAIPEGQTSVSFTYVEEVGSVPMPQGRLRDWSLAIGYDNKAKTAQF